jgi:hypothetical protein
LFATANPATCCTCEPLSTRRAGLTYADLAERLKAHGLPSETEASIKAKLRRGTFAATFLLATLAALEMDGMRLEDL